MQKKSKSDRCQTVNINVVLVNEILGLTNPRVRNVDDMITSQDDVRLRKVTEVVKRCFEIESNGMRGYSIPIGAFSDMHSSVRAYDSSETFEIAIPRELHQLMLSVRSVLEMGGQSATDTEILRYFMWTKFPASITPNGHLVASGSTSWIYDAAGLLNVYQDSYGELQFSQPFNISVADIIKAFDDGTWTPVPKATSVMIKPGHRISVLVVEVLREVDDENKDDSTEETTLNIKEDTDNESIK